LRCADHGVGNSGVAAGGVEQDFPGLQFPAALRFQQPMRSSAFRPSRFGVALSAEAGPSAGFLVETCAMKSERCDYRNVPDTAKSWYQLQ
jgi:hypothetical protein